MSEKLDPLVVDFEFMSAEVTPEVDEAINEFIRSHSTCLDHILAPHGLTAAEIKLPRWRRLLSRYELQRRLDGWKPDRVPSPPNSETGDDHA